MTSFCQIFIFQFRITSIQIVSFLILFPILLRLCCSFPYPRFVIQITENMFIIFYAAIFSCRMPMPLLSIFLKDLSVFKITEKCSIYYLFFLFRMQFLVTRSSLILFSDQNFGKYVYMVNLLLQRITAGVLCSFSNPTDETPISCLLIRI